MNASDVSSRPRKSWKQVGSQTDSALFGERNILFGRGAPLAEVRGIRGRQRLMLTLMRKGTELSSKQERHSLVELNKHGRTSMVQCAAVTFRFSHMPRMRSLELHP